MSPSLLDLGVVPWRRSPVRRQDKPLLPVRVHSPDLRAQRAAAAASRSSTSVSRTWAARRGARRGVQAERQLCGVQVCAPAAMTVALSQAAAAPTAAARRTSNQARHADAGAQLAATALAAFPQRSGAGRARVHSVPRTACAAATRRTAHVQAARRRRHCCRTFLAALAARSSAQPAHASPGECATACQQPCRRKRRSGASASAVPLRSGAPRAARPPRRPGAPPWRSRSGCCT
jgi:hypothetical protein